MQLVFADDELPQRVTKTIFLAGPNPRYKDGDAIQQTWRHEALKLLEEYEFDGHVFIPLPKGSFFGETVVGAVSDYDHQVKWEDLAMARADVLLFYVDRRNGLQGLTTNIEFGRYLDSGRMVYGRPNDAENTRYLDEQVRKRKRRVCADMPGVTLPNGLQHSLKQCVYEALDRLREGAFREGPEVLVPLLFWRAPQFQDWYRNLGNNELRGFEPKAVITFNTSRSIHNNDGFLFGFSAWVNVYITDEQREKSNEWIFSRTYTSYVVPYFVDPKTGEHKYVLVREFRSPANNPQGYVYELPGGSSTDGKDISPYVNAQKEVEEETGIKIDDISRFRFLGNRQTFATFSTNKIFATAVELTPAEFQQVQHAVQQGTVFGENDEERIKLFIVTESDLVDDYDSFPVDYTTLGIIHLAKHLQPIHGEFERLTTWIRNAEHGKALEVFKHFQRDMVLEQDREWSKEGINALLHQRLIQVEKEGSTIAETEPVYRITNLGLHIVERLEALGKGGFESA